MSVQVRRRRESAAFLSTFVGAQGELLVDTTNNRVQVHDGATPGGFPAAKLGEVLTNARTAVADVAYTALVSDRTIAYTAITAPRVVTLPAAAAYPTGTQLLVFDESGACSTTNTITIARAGSDTINGTTNVAITTAYGYLAVESNGAGRWTLVDQTVAAASTAATRTPVADANYTSLTSDRLVAYTALTAARTVTLPAAAAFPVGTQLRILDESGAASASVTITLTRAGSDTIDGAASAVISTAYGSIAIQSNGTAKWTITDQAAGALATNSVANAALAQMPALTLKSNITGSTANAADNALSAILDAALGTTRGAALYRGAAGWAALAPGASGNVFTSNGPGADPSYQAAGSGASAPAVLVRQTVMGGPAASGAPSFLPATASSLSLTAQTISSSAPLTLTAAQGTNASGALNSVYQFTANPSWSSLAASTTNYLWVNAQAGAIGSTTLAPIYQFGGTIATTNGQFTFDIQAMTGWLGNGSAAVATPLVFVGQATTSASAVTSAIAYAYNRRYVSALIGASTGVATYAHNIGTAFGMTVRTALVNQTSEQGYSVGDEVSTTQMSSAASPATNGGVSDVSGPLVNTLLVANNIFVLNKTSPTVPTSITPANWKMRSYVSSTW